MPPEPEAQARQHIDRLLTAAGWHVCDYGAHDISKPCAIREFPLKQGHGHADYLLYLHGKAVGVIEAKKVGHTLKGVEIQSDKYTTGLPDELPAWKRPLPFAFESTGTETQFTNNLDPEPCSRKIFAFYKPAGLARLLDIAATDQAAEYIDRGRTFLACMNNLSALIEEGLWPAQIIAIRNLDQSLQENRPRALVQMATGFGKTFSANSLILGEDDNHFRLKYGIAAFDECQFSGRLSLPTSSNLISNQM